ncbi:regulatory signaling modulator protein AmpE [Ectopseudomonas mendocina]|uniref:Regulatory signaling modulator protein AmpE n=1 Tax=Ectopseudomonas mendocina TaxID=300 RepID=A0ABZ2RDE9_ECTME
MNFLVLLLVLWVEKFSSWRSPIQNDGPFLRLLAAVQGQGEDSARPWVSLLLIVLLPVLALGLILLALESVMYGWLALPVHLLVVVYSLGRGDLQAALGPFRDSWRRGDAEAAYLVAQRDLGIEAEEPATLLERVQKYMVWEAFQSFFAVIFWYALLGPMAALGYRLVALLSEHATQPALKEIAGQVRHGFDWLPVRMLALSFSLVGNFSAVSRSLLHELLSWDISAAQLAVMTARAAGEIPSPALGEEGVATLDTLWQLLVRAAMFWYAIVAVWILLV